jgi:hypothetical protein
MWDANKEEIDSGEILVGCGKIRRLTQEEIKPIHEYVNKFYNNGCYP